MKQSVSFIRKRRSLSAPLVYLALAIATVLTCLFISPAVAQLRSTDPDQLLQQSQTFYKAGQYRQAIPLLQQAAQVYQEQGDRLRQVLTLSNLSLSYQQVGRWQEARDAIAQSLAIVQTQPRNQTTRSLLAQTLDVQARLQFAEGQPAAALATWQQSAATYEQLGDRPAMVENRLHQSEALQALGLYQRAIDSLSALSQSLAKQPPSLVQVAALRQLGEAELLAGDFLQARRSLEHSQTLAQKLSGREITDAIALTTLSLGNLTRTEASDRLAAADLTLADAQQPTPITPTEVAVQRRIQATLQAYTQQVEAAITFYQQAAQTPVTQLQAQLNQFSLLVETQQWQRANTLYADLQAQLQTQTPTYASLYNQIEFAQSLIQLESKNASPPRQPAIQQLLDRTYQQAVELDNRRAQSYTLGTLGTFYKTTGALAEAQAQTQRAIALAEAINAPEVTYRWQHQAGQIFKAQQEYPKAIQAYESAYATLQDLRRDVVTTRLSYQLAFRETAEEPIYRELISLLLKEQIPSQEHLKRSREVATSLQVAQLENFLSKPCSDPNPQQVDDTVDRLAATTAVLYPIVLSDRLEVIVKLPQQKALAHFRAQVPAHEVQRVVRSLQLDLEQDYTFDAVKANSQRLYQWIVKPIQQQLQAKQVDTLVFALDGFLRTVPMPVLFDGNHYLVETYATAVTLGLDLPSPTTIQRETAKVLAVGLTDPPKDFQVNSKNLSANFAKLPNVNTELDAIATSGFSLTAIRDQEFTQETFNRTLNQAAFPIVHLATHGQFSSDPNSTFLLTANGAIAANDLSQLFQTRSEVRPDAIELLILNACETAEGDQLAALGIAGTAFRAGARSVIASLWTLDDTSSLALTQQLYQHLAQPQNTKAAALRQAQLALLANPQYDHPRYWATYVLLGNWL